MTMMILEQLIKQDNFTATEARLAEFILSQEADFSQMSIQHLASKSYCSHASVIRLAKKLGFAGFKDFKISLIKEIQNQANVIEEVDPNFPFSFQDDYQIISKRMADLSMTAIQKTVKNLNKENLNALALNLARAHRLFLYGIGDSGIRAQSFQNKLLKIGRYAIWADEHGEDAWNSVNMTANDMAILISYGGKTSRQQRILQFLRQQKIKTLLITSNRSTEPSHLADYIIDLPQGEENVKIGTFYSQIALEYVLDLLFALIYSQSYSQHSIDIKRKRRLVKKHFDDDLGEK